MIRADFSATTWLKSSYSGEATNCVEIAFAPTAWHKSSYSGNTTNCVEFAATTRAVGVRDSKDPHAAPLVFTPAQWRTFLTT